MPGPPPYTPHLDGHVPKLTTQQYALAFYNARDALNACEHIADYTNRTIRVVPIVRSGGAKPVYAIRLIADDGDGTADYVPSTYYYPGCGF